MSLSLRQAMELYGNNVFRAAFSIVKNRQDAEDITQDTFLAFYRSDPDLGSDEHVRAWLLRTGINKAKNLCRTFWRRHRENLDDYADVMAAAPDDESDVLREVMKLPGKCRVIIHLFYYEDYSINEIAALLGISENTVKSQLFRGRTLLKERLKEGWDND